MRSRIGAAVVVSLVVPTAACRDDAGEVRLSKEQWIERADEICRDENASLGELEEPDVDPFDPNLTDEQLAELADFLEASLRVEEQATERLDDLGLPDDEAGDIEDVLEQRREGRTSAELAIDAARRGDAESFVVSYRDAVVDYDGAAQGARQFGLEDCGQG
jgi:hypothetical protein